ncbi:MAG TPA: multicopper oxidase domain-containing protein, partial [Gemmatimonadaceae bacterium]
MHPDHELPPPALSELLAAAEAPRGDAGDAGDAGGAGDARPVLLLGQHASAAGLAGPVSRRGFLARASVLSLAVPGLGAALAGCARDDQRADSTAGGAGTRTETSGRGAADRGALQNSSSRLDTAVVHEAHGRTTAAGVTAASVPFHRYDPTLPPAATGGVVKLHWHARETAVRIDDDTVVAGWTFEGDIPGPIVHCRVGDTVEFTLTNDVDIPHSMDFHAAQVDPKVAFRSVTKGQSVTYTFKPKWAGAFMYHCGTAPVLMHIGSGMYGAIIVSPKEGLAPAREFVLVQGECYLGAAGAGGVRPFDYQKMLSTLPDFVSFNGRPNQYIEAPIRVKRGDRVRFWVVNAGPTHPCNFHVVGEQ